MKKSDAIRYFGGQVNLARAVERAPSTVAEWPEIVPLDHAFVLQELTKHRKPRLKVDYSLYPKLPKGLRPQ